MKGPYRTLYADPPWSFRDKGSRVAPDSTRKDDRSARSYPTASTEDICAMPVGELATPDAVLFLWSTWAHLLDGSAAQVATAWGFRPVVAVPWIKVSSTSTVSRASWVSHPAVAQLYSHGLKLQIAAGHYVRGVAEPLLICRRKKTQCVEAARRLPGVIAAPRPKGHSSKPQAARVLIESLYPEHSPRLELFLRGDAPEGWHGWGNEATGPRALSSLEVNA